MELEIMKMFHNKCKKCNKVTFDEDEFKKIQDIKEKVIEKTDRFLEEIDKSIVKLKNLHNEFGMHDTIVARVEMLIEMQCTATTIKKFTNTLLKKDKNMFKCDDCKSICVIEYLYNNLERTICYFDTSDNAITQRLGSLFKSFVKTNMDENINKRIKYVFEDEGHFNRICIEFTHMTYYLKNLQKLIIEKQICAKISDDERKLILESLNNDFINYKNWLNSLYVRR